MKYMQRIQFYPSKELFDILNEEAKKYGVSVSQLVTATLEECYGLTSKSGVSITQLTTTVLKEIEDSLGYCNGKEELDHNTASPSYKLISMISGKKPSTIRASIGRSFGRKIGKEPFSNVRKCIINGNQRLSVNNALVYETFAEEDKSNSTN